MSCRRARSAAADARCRFTGIFAGTDGAPHPPQRRRPYKLPVSLSHYVPGSFSLGKRDQAGFPQAEPVLIPAIGAGAYYKVVEHANPKRTARLYHAAGEGDILS